MTKPIGLMWMLVIGAAAIGLSTAANKASAARFAAQARVANYQALADRVCEYERLHAQTARWPSAPTQTSLAQEVSVVLAAAGLPASALANLSPDTGSAVPGSPGLIQLRAGLTLTHITLPELGRFLGEWRRRQASQGSNWTITSIDLTPELAKSETPAAGGDLPLQALLSAESMVADGGEP